MKIRELMEADPDIVALSITIRRDHKFVKEYLIGSHVSSGRYYKEVGKNEKWTQLEEDAGTFKFRRAMSFRAINYKDLEGGSACGTILKAVPKKLLDLDIELLRPSSGIFFDSWEYRGQGDYHGYFIDSPIDGEWKDLLEEKIVQDPTEEEEEEYLKDEDLLKPKEENISFDDLLGGEE